MLTRPAGASIVSTASRLATASVRSGSTTSGATSTTWVPASGCWRAASTSHVRAVRATGRPVGSTTRAPVPSTSVGLEHPEHLTARLQREQEAGDRHAGHDLTDLPAGRARHRDARLHAAGPGGRAGRGACRAGRAGRPGSPRAGRRSSACASSFGDASRSLAVRTVPSGTPRWSSTVQSSPLVARRAPRRLVDEQHRGVEQAGRRAARSGTMRAASRRQLGRRAVTGARPRAGASAGPSATGTVSMPGTPRSDTCSVHTCPSWKRSSWRRYGSGCQRLTAASVGCITVHGSARWPVGGGRQTSTSVVGRSERREVGAVWAPRLSSRRVAAVVIARATSARLRSSAWAGVSPPTPAMASTAAAVGGRERRRVTRDPGAVGHRLLQHGPRLGRVVGRRRRPAARSGRAVRMPPIAPGLVDAEHRPHRPGRSAPTTPRSIASTARGPNTMPSSSEFDASRLAPCTPVSAASPAAHRPSSDDGALEVGDDPAARVVGGRRDRQPVAARVEPGAAQRRRRWSGSVRRSPRGRWRRATRARRAARASPRPRPATRRRAAAARRRTARRPRRAAARRGPAAPRRAAAAASTRGGARSGGTG